MGPIEAVRDSLRNGDADLDALDAAQLVKHMFGLRSESHRRNPLKPAVLVYLYCEPDRWPDGSAIDADKRLKHAASVERFSQNVAGGEVGFRRLAYKQLIASWDDSSDAELRCHAAAIRGVFSPF